MEYVTYFGVRADEIDFIGNVLISTIAITAIFVFGKNVSAPVYIFLLAFGVLLSLVLAKNVCRETDEE